MEEKQTAIDNLYGSPNLQGLKTWNKAREPAGQPPEKVCQSGTRVERARDDTDNVFRDNPESNRENLHNRHGTAVRAGFSTGLGSRKTAEKRPVIPPEWERYAEKLEVGSTKMEDGRPKTEVGRRPAAAPQNLCSMRYYLFWMKVQRTETLTGNMECKIRKSEDGRRKTEDGRPKTEVGRRPAAAPQNLCSMRYYLFWMKVQRTETLNGKMECKIRKLEVGSWKTEVGSWKTEDGRQKLEEDQRQRRETFVVLDVIYFG
ncbi:hypothetical protein [Mariniphaga sp.]|uniref:hypothetical protein n=1 Tax=Mariniphaga sp. TaxID=1954475 RepID=UPI0035668F50